MISQGDIYWVDLGEPSGSAPGYLHPHVIIQNDEFNQSRINTIITCAITSNLGLGSSPGNVLLNKGEANLPKQSVVNVSQVYTVDKSQLLQKIGALSSRRIRQVLDGLYLLLEPDSFESWG